MTAGSDLDDFRGLLAKAFDERVVAWTAEAEAQERFPRQLIEHLGVCGVFDAKWATDARPDVGKLVELAFALGQLASAGIGVGVSLHDSAIAILRRFGKSDYLRDICDQAIRGAAVLCIGASEESGGSDLQIVETEIRSRDGGFEVRGVKKFVSLSPIADHIMVVARSVDHDPTSRHGNVAVVAVPAAQVSVQTPYRKVGAGPLDTAAVCIDTWVPADALVARAGTGLAAISWGLAWRADVDRRADRSVVSTGDRNHPGPHDESTSVRSDAVRTPGAAAAYGGPAGACRSAAVRAARHR